MATPVTELHRRLRNAGVSEEQAEAITSAFESLSTQINALRAEIVELKLLTRVHTAMLVLILAGVLGPYVANLFGTSG